MAAENFTLEKRPGSPGYVFATDQAGHTYEVYLQYGSIDPMTDAQPRLTDPAERAALLAACRAFRPAPQVARPVDHSRDIPDVRPQMRRAGFEVDMPADPAPTVGTPPMATRYRAQVAPTVGTPPMATRYRAQISRTGSPQTYTGIALVADLMAPTYEVEIDGQPGRTFTLPRHLVTLGAIEGTVPTPGK